MMNRANKEYPNASREEVVDISLLPILEGIGMTHINLFSLEDECAELDILKTIPFEKVKIDLFVTEYALSSRKGLDSKVTERRCGEFQNFFKRLGCIKKYTVRLPFFYGRI